MSDRELLELAAKAAGIPYTKPTEDYDGSLGLAAGDNPMRTQGWNPLTDDGDALRLAHKLGLLSDVPVWPRTLEETRRAIVRAAAEIGKEMK